MTTSGSRRWSGKWASQSERARPDAQPVVDVLIPTADRGAELAVTLAGLAGQNDPPFRVTVSDQSLARLASTEPVVRAMKQVLEAQGRPVEFRTHLPRRGLAEHRQSLLDSARAEYVLFLDDDVWLEPGTLCRLVGAIRALRCGFVGCAVQGLSYLNDRRPEEQKPFRRWEGTVEPERVRRGTPEFEQWTLHNAANLTHLAADLPIPVGDWVAYHVAWIGGCVLYKRAALTRSGGFDFWPQLPVAHAGEDVAAQWRVMERFGGAGILPSGAVHLESPTTVPTRDAEAFDVVFPMTSVGSQLHTHPSIHNEERHNR